ncbi:tyrosine-type recombinase/integrase [Microbacterium sp.]|uniref:tyrosine-type recombinase/integrase n=1 Tax=Microbacterium sp. TaxID=51671 RepID=UPI003F99660B
MLDTTGSRPSEPDTITLNQLFERYLPLVLADVAPKTAYAYQNAWRKRVSGSLGQLPVVGITGLDIRMAWTGWDGVPSTKTDALAVASKTLSVAVDAGLIRSNPARGLRLKRKPGKSPAARALSPDELDAFIARTPEGHYRRIIVALAYTGCRLGEVAGLTRADVDVERGLIRVARSLSPDPTGKLVAGDTKSHRDRVVPILMQLLPVIEEAAEGKNPHDLLFTGPRGGALDSGNLTRSIGLQVWRDEVRVYPPGEPPLHLHDLRHTALTLMCRAGIPAPDVQRIAGHSSLAVTQLYARGNDESALRAGERFGAFLAGQQRKSTL